MYRAFLDILNMYRKGTKTIRIVDEEVGTCSTQPVHLAAPICSPTLHHYNSRRLLQVAVLFRSHNDLLQEFQSFLPDDDRPPSSALSRLSV
jgi:histone deacetylase complex regulatory component SIN3